MLMAGQGKNKKVVKKNLFEKQNQYYEFIFKKFGTKNFILIQKNYTRGLGKRYNIYDIKIRTQCSKQLKNLNTY